MERVVYFFSAMAFFIPAEDSGGGSRFSRMTVVMTCAWDWRFESIP